MQAPVPIAGVKGIRFLGKQIVKLAAGPKRDTYLPHYLGHIVRMQEEIGTGGAGFRFIYASFLQESAKQLDNPALNEAAKALTDAGDEWRRFALIATKMCRGRTEMNPALLEKTLNDIADREEAVWRRLKTI
jgi:hypothetical protein